MTFKLPKNVKGSVKKIELVIISKNKERKIITHTIGEKKVINKTTFNLLP